MSFAAGGMKTPDAFAAYHAHLIEAAYDCVDRLGVNCYDPLGQAGGGFRTFWRQWKGNDSGLSGEALRQAAEDLARRLKAYCRQQGILWIECGAGDLKYQIALERILDLAATQLKAGGAFHQYQPLNKRGKFENEPGSEQPLYEHLRRSFQYTLDRLGPHGLPLIGRADWNDCLNLNCFSDTPGQSFQTTTSKDGKVAESVFIAGLFVLAAKELAAIAARRNLNADAKQCLAEAAKMAKVVYRHGWDGEWFVRAYDDFGKPIGSKVCDEGKIFIESQGICIMAGIGLEDGKAARALESVTQHLATRHGIVLQQPAYSKYYLHLGEISSYPPGYKENAGIFCHNNPWIIIAETMVGNGNRAFDYYTRINPSAREKIGHLHRCEPYVFAQMIAGKDAPTHGEAKNSWLTGTAAWTYYAATQWILGIRAEYDGLRIDPVIPAKWKGFTVTRRFRGNTYLIEVKNPKGKQRGVRMLRVDGKDLATNILPVSPPRPEPIRVEAVLED